MAENLTTGLLYSVPILYSAEYPDGVPIGTFVVHDLYNNGTYGIDGRPYNVGYWAQWQQNGVKRTVWHDPTKDTKGYNDQYSPMDSQRNLTVGNLVWPINHDEHGWELEETSMTESTEIESSYTTETSIPCENNPPEVTITGIKDGVTYSGTITIEISITDESDIEEATIRIKDGDIDVFKEIDLDYAAGTWIGSYNIDTTDFSDDTYTITIRVYDSCDNLKTIRFDVDFNNDLSKTETEPTEESTLPDLTISTPGFDLLVVLIILGNIVFLVKRQKRRRISD